MRRRVLYDLSTPRVLVLDFDCTTTGSDLPTSKSDESNITSLIPPHHFYYAIRSDPIGKQVNSIFKASETSSKVPTLNLDQIEWCANLFGSYHRLYKLKQVFETLTRNGDQIMIFTRGYSWHVGCVLKIAGLLRYISAIAGFSSLTGNGQWLNVKQNWLSPDLRREYKSKDDEILKLLAAGYKVRYIDDDPEEHIRVLLVLNSSSKQVNYGNLGRSGSICCREDIRSNCIKVDTFQKNGNGMTLEMMDQLMEGLD